MVTWGCRAPHLLYLDLATKPDSREAHGPRRSPKVATAAPARPKTRPSLFVPQVFFREMVSPRVPISNR
jgi:hypothetical protein